MTPIKAAAEPSREDDLLKASKPLFEAMTRINQCLADYGWTPRRSHVEGYRNAMETTTVALARLAAAPAGNVGVSEALENSDDDRPLPTYGQIPWKQLGRDVHDAIFANRRDFDFGEGYPGHKALPALNFNSLARIVDKYRYYGIHPQPREAFADEVKRADAAPPEASFDNASDMLEYLNAPAREAEPVAPPAAFASILRAIYRIREWAKNEGPYSEIIKEAAIIERRLEQIALASPSPIPDVTVGLIEQAAKMLEQRANGYASRSSTIYNGSIIASELRTNAQLIRALKPQDGGESLPDWKQDQAETSRLRPKESGQ